MTTTTCEPSKPKQVLTEEQKQRKSAYAKRKRQEAPEEEKQKQRERSARYYQKNKAHALARIKNWRNANPTTYLMREYGITAEERDALFVAQGSVCAICKADKPSNSKGWVVDHCHSEGHVRGVLCSHCNSLLGYARDNPATLAAAITYLGK